MQLWQLDVTDSAFLADGREVKIVTGIDDHSRYCVIARVVLRATARPVCWAFVEAMTIYGVLEEVLTDNGTVFTGWFIKLRSAEVLFERICWENGITQRLTRLWSLTTTGKIERLHQSLQLELLDVHGSFESLAALQAALDAWREEYNSDRPHQSLGMAFPASRFTPAVSPLPLRVLSQLIAASTRQAEQPELLSAELSAAPAPDGQQALLVAVEADRVVRRQATCGLVGSRSGSARCWRTGRSLSGWMRPACMYCWMALGSRRCCLGSASQSWLGWPLMALVPRGRLAAGWDWHSRRGGAHGQRRRLGRPGRRSVQRRLPAGRAAGRLADGWHSDGRHHR